MGTMAVQFGSAWINSRMNNQKADNLAAKQRAYEEKVAREGIDRARGDYAEICSLQRELESSVHKDRISRLRECHGNILRDIAYKHSLQKWPLLVPPYVITNQSLLTLDDNQHALVPPTCILTTSWDRKFNEAIFPRLEERIARFCARHWNISMPKSIRFMQQAWRDNTIDARARVKNLHAHLKAIPTLVISSKISDVGLSFPFQWWGISTAACDCAINESRELTIELNVPVTQNRNYTEEEIRTIVEGAGNQLEMLISYFADLYYWYFYAEIPKLPYLADTKILPIDGECKKFLYKSYLEAFENQLHIKRELVKSLQYLESVSCLSGKSDFLELATKNIENITSRRAISVSELRNLRIFNNKHRISKINETISSLLTEEIETVEIIENIPVDKATIEYFVSVRQAEALDTKSFLYIYWGNNAVIGTFLRSDGQPTIYRESNSTRIFVLMNREFSYPEVLPDNLPLNLIVINDETMDTKQTTRHSKLLNSVGDRMIQTGERLKQAGLRLKSHTSPSEDNGSNTMQAFADYFLKGIDEGTISSTRMGLDMSIAPVLSWLDDLKQEQVANNNQVYIIKCKHNTKDLVLYCVFLAFNDSFNLDETPKHCFICDNEPVAMKEIFLNTQVHIIPFK